MFILNKLQQGGGHTLAKLAKQVAEMALNGQEGIVEEAVELCVYDFANEKAKGIRSAAVKILEILAEHRPEFVVGFLGRLIAVLDVEEVQTRLGAIRVLGLCAQQDPEEAKKAFSHAIRFMNERGGISLFRGALEYMGRIGSLSPEDAQDVYAAIVGKLPNAPENESDWILEALSRIMPYLTVSQINHIEPLVKMRTSCIKKSTRDRAEKLIKRIKDGTLRE